MSTILLPASPLPKSATPRPLDFGAWQAPIGGGTVTRLDRPGNRMAVDFVTPQLRQEPDGRIWSSRLNQAVGSVVRIPFPQPWRSSTVASIGGCVVNGSGQGGFALSVRGAAANYPLLEGQAFNVFDAGGHAYIHFLTVDVATDGTGHAILPVYPMLRFAPADASITNFDLPVIEGQLTGNEKGWTMIRAFTQGLEFTVAEVR